VRRSCRGSREQAGTLRPHRAEVISAWTDGQLCVLEQSVELQGEIERDQVVAIAGEEQDLIGALCRVVPSASPLARAGSKCRRGGACERAYGLRRRRTGVPL
jgi:hypothetical protein